MRTLLRAACRSIAIAGLALATYAGFQAIVWAYSGHWSDGGLRQRPASRIGAMVGAIPMTDGVKLIHRFRVADDHWTAFRIRTVTWGHVDRPGRCRWVLYELRRDERIEVRRGRFRAAEVADWGTLAQRFEEIPDSAGRTYELVFSAPETPMMESAGLAVYQATGGLATTTVKDARSSGEPLNLAANVEHQGVGPALTLIHGRGTR